jgi:hypothetical protein
MSNQQQSPVKKCSSCKEIKTLDNYGTHSNGKLRPQCKTCVTERHYERKYGITLEDYNKMYKEQGGVCKICHLPANHNSNKLCVDHCHTTGEVRGLLCDTCNRGLGYFKDDTRLLQNSIEYLEANARRLQNLSAGIMAST